MFYKHEIYNVKLQHCEVSVAICASAGSPNITVEDVEH